MKNKIVVSDQEKRSRLIELILDNPSLTCDEDYMSEKKRKIFYTKYISKLSSEEVEHELSEMESWLEGK